MLPSAPQAARENLRARFAAAGILADDADDDLPDIDDAALDTLRIDLPAGAAARALDDSFGYPGI